MVETTIYQTQTGKVIGHNGKPIMILSDLNNAELTVMLHKLQACSQRDESKCWNWKFSKRPNGYGVISIYRNKKECRYAAHRVSFYLATTIDPLDKSVCHRCDNPSCINPAHLFLATNNENIADKVTKGRSNKGVDRYNAKLNDEKVRDIRRRYGSGEISQPKLALEYGVSKSRISEIVRGIKWRHVS